MDNYRKTEKMKPLPEGAINNGSSPAAIIRNIKELSELHNIELPQASRYNIRLINGDNLGVNKIIEMADTPELLYCLALNKGKEAVFIVNKARINYISVYSKEYSDAYNKSRGYHE